jgi:hypothetical protein
MVAGSIPNEVIGFFFFNLPNPSNRTMALGSIRPTTEISTRISWGKGGLRLRLTTSPQSVSRLRRKCENPHKPMGFHIPFQGQFYLHRVYVVYYKVNFLLERNGM